MPEQVARAERGCGGPRPEAEWTQSARIDSAGIGVRNRAQTYLIQLEQRPALRRGSGLRHHRRRVSYIPRQHSGHLRLNRRRSRYGTKIYSFVAASWRISPTSLSHGGL